MIVLICDDSIVARKSLAKCLNGLGDHTAYFAENGREAIEILAKARIDVLFLDLTMPVMDGFEVLEHLPVNTYETKIVIISGDVQAEAKKRCSQLGAHAFIGKPFENESISNMLENIDIQFQQITNPRERRHQNTQFEPIDWMATFREVTNIALGQGAAIIADHMGQFIHMPIPNVGELEGGVLTMTIEDVLNREGSVAVAQRFVGAGIHGEALVCMRGKDIGYVGEKLGFTLSDASFNEVVINVANLLVSSYLVSLGEQFKISFSLRQPTVIDHFHLEINNLSIERTERIFTIEYIYEAEGIEFECEVLFLVDRSSVNVIRKFMEAK